MQSLTDISAVRGLLDRHGFRFSKSLGQNFLINPTVCPRMAEACGADQDTGVLEIGPGIGVLTRELCLRAAKVVSVEIDSKLLPLLDETLEEHNNLKIIHGDAMKLDLHELIEREFKGLRVCVCANLPYYITSPIIMGLLESRIQADSITVMVQKEAAVRLCAQPGTRECGAVTLAVRFYAQPKMLFPVSRGSFMPAPRVDSAVIQLDIRKSPPFEVKNEELLFKIIKGAFGQRRKTLVNALAGAGFDKASVGILLDKTDISRLARAEELSLEQFIRVANTACEVDLC
ncbi:MAG: 16S rRNA (adenine(1518)-N(6)/adenine(1519)-N(6))-dimethyltransferase RsmA [Oscillospiraceae bacterium]|nr:16S rRNA (adenine(1518)-N(6)/adenine(1519)-N(6))-dimethyltransferase RsmA [Oscillospiraceae bacterium]MDD3833002.1 16S rRNA (adenine(1518)-N(6)/adenine(1519)-N(6))-dimethyltransferase RsmA [Oscillospiraceae bacterium]MDD4545817.1 16S rRNA (adenine(1518)-N(6)/adenine(1519)-N(6))-dimethyltransferase RsmA [Oscillospiraceae bacterium]